MPRARRIEDPDGVSGMDGNVRPDRGSRRARERAVIRVLVAEDMLILRDALVSLIDGEDGFEVVAALADGAAVLPAALRHRPDVALLDVGLPGRDGFAAAADLRDELPGCRTLILTADGRPAHLRRSVAVGAAGFLVKDSTGPDLAAAIRVVGAGGRVVDPKLAYAALALSECPLTPRELEVLRLTAGGAGPREVAAQLYLAYGTVRNYLASAVMKLGARNRIDALRIATETGWI